MTDPNEDVTPSASSPDPDPQDPSPSPAAAVSAVDDDVVVGDRPLKNIIAEIDRKNAQRMDAFKAEMIAALGSVPRPQATPVQREYSDQELSQLAASGDANAQLLLSDRLAARHAAEQARTQSQAQAEAAKLSSLFARYPVLRDGSHALTQYAMQVKSALLGSGRPNDVATVIESITTAIADNPEVAAQSAVRLTTPSVSRPSAPTVAAAAPAPRRAAAPSPKTTISDAQWTLAQRYGYKTREAAAKAIENMERRQAAGQSKLGAVGAMIREDA